MEKYTNALAKESSPYLLQHAHNPVDWVPWSPDVFERAEKENKLVLISVGYSACHWCHVMEHESFESEEVAAIMNKHFINVKVDREERPDVDQVYMTAVQLMTQSGGWPLNCFTLPDGRPIYGGTYFPKEQWMNILKSLRYTYDNEKEKVLEYAANLHEGIQRSELISVASDSKQFDKDVLEELIQRWSKSFDHEWGGSSRAPKFPLPSNMEFLLNYGLLEDDNAALQHVETTLDQMALGGIYDQVGGGFSRYSVDMLWKVPHFEKMLYDNGQLLTVYARAYAVFKKPLYKRIIEQTVQWMEREMLDDSGAFYAALDADSEGVEGKFYVWTAAELENVLDRHFGWFRRVYEINQNGHWEDGNYILLRRKSDVELCNELDCTQEEFEAQLNRVNELLLSARSHRIRPGLDNKCLTGWNAMTVRGLCEAYMVLGEDHYLHLAEKVMKWITNHQWKDGKLYRNYNDGKTAIEGFLEDYAHTIDACIAMYQATFKIDWLLKGKELMDHCIQAFGDGKSQMFFFTDAETKLIARKMEINDNVIPSSNSVMARNLYYLGRYLNEASFLERSRTMLANVYDGMEQYGSGYSNWGMVLLHEIYGLAELVTSERKDVFTLQKSGVPFLLPAVINAELPLTVSKLNSPKDQIMVCFEGACQMPTTDWDTAKKQVYQR
ncbi:MAG: thioredoxin domain-containing protein [bacterium]|nr:thioredoxin domain-containing protein [bacterium]